MSMGGEDIFGGDVGGGGGREGEEDAGPEAQLFKERHLVAYACIFDLT